MHSYAVFRTANAAVLKLWSVCKGLVQNQKHWDGRRLYVSCYNFCSICDMTYYSERDSLLNQTFYKTEDELFVKCLLQCSEGGYVER